MAYVQLNNNVIGPGTHCLVISVGKYEPNDWQIPDLNSPVQSAAAFVQWLKTEYNNPGAPLASIEVVSSPLNASAPDRATRDNTEAAVTRWFNLCDKAAENVGIFYFCGHGFQKGSSQVLLLEGFAAPGKLSVGSDAIDFQNFTLGMNRCSARRQIYFVDACRATPKSVLQIPSQLGAALVEPNYALIKTNVRRNWPVIYSTAENHAAFGTNGKVSVFTDALIRCLQGAGWDDHDDPWNDWYVNSDSLATFVRDLMTFESSILGIPIQVPIRGGESTGFVIHRPGNGQSPLVPLLVQRRSTNQTATFEVRLGGTVKDARAAGPAEDYRVILPAGPKYVVSAAIGANTAQMVIPLRPACKTVYLEI